MGAILSGKKETVPAEKPKITKQDKAVLVSSQGLTFSFMSHQVLLFHREVMVRSPFLEGCLKNISQLLSYLKKKNNSMLAYRE